MIYLKKFKFRRNLLFIIIFFILINLNLENRYKYIFANLNNSTETQCETNSIDINNILNEVFDEKDNYILNKDIENLKKFYNLNNKFSNWAYESEVKKINYLNNWSEKQGIEFKNIKSNIIINKVKEKEKGVYSIICTISTRFTYCYSNELDCENTFGLGTTHYLDLINDNDEWIINKEWYTDPFADCLNLNKLKVNKIREFILSQQHPEYTLSDRLEKAINYAHLYCGATISDDSFNYNTNYQNFNAQGGDCANFASQILLEGGFKKNSTWNYSKGNGTKSWVNAQAFKNYMINSGRANYITKGNYEKIYKDAYKLRPGDFVAYEKNGKITHISTVTGLDSKGYPLVTCHNTDRLLVPYDLGWSNDNIIFHLIHVNY